MRSPSPCLLANSSVRRWWMRWCSRRTTSPRFAPGRSPPASSRRRLTVLRAAPAPAFDPSEPIRLLRVLRDAGVELVNITMGNPYFNPHVNRPFDMGPYTPPEHPLEGEARMFDCIGQIKRAHPELKIISSGHSYLRSLAPYLAACSAKAPVWEKQSTTFFPFTNGAIAARFSF